MVNRQYKKDRRIRGRELHVLSGRDLAAQKRMKNPLTALTPKVVRNLYETYRKGFMADIQLNWDAIEEYDETLGTVVDRRQSALGEMDWDVRIDQRLVAENAELQELAEQQRVYMAARFNRVGNLMEAVKWLGMANFRRATFIQVFEQPGVDEEVWRRVPPWCISHPDHEGAWVYDETAATYPHKADEVLMEHVIFREVERPVDLPCLALVVAKNMGITNWDGFLDTFGIPAVMVKMPPDTTDERREEFMDIAREIIGDGRGVFPDGTEINTIEATQNFANSFTERVDWCDKAMVRRATGGMLTVLAESGSGTLAGSAHMEAFRQLAANDAAGIAECINRQYTRRVLAAVFPGQPALVRFELIPPVTDDRAAQAQILATLAGAGFKPSAEVVSEMMGFEVAAVEQQPDFGGRMLDVGFNSSAAAPQVVTNSKAETPVPQPDALSAEELNALQSLAGARISAEALQGTSQAIADALQEAVTNSAEDNEVVDLTSLIDEIEGAAEEDGEVIENTSGTHGCRAKDPQKCRIHGGFWHPAISNALNNQPGGTTAKALGLEKLSDIPGDRASTLIEVQRAREAMHNGKAKVRTMEGDWVEFDKKTADHIEYDHRRPSATDRAITEGEDRMQKLVDAMRTVRQPHEVWQEIGEDGKPTAKIYLRVFEIEGGKKAMLGVRWESESKRMHTYYQNLDPDKLERKRKGKLLYKRNAGTR